MLLLQIIQYIIQVQRQNWYIKIQAVQLMRCIKNLILLFIIIEAIK